LVLWGVWGVWGGRGVEVGCVNAGVAAESLTWPTSSEPVPVAVKRPASATVAMPETWRSVAAITPRCGSGSESVVVLRPDQFSFEAPPLARFSCNLPLARDNVNRSTPQQTPI